ncbi:hypothetical protein Tco_0720400 [Tanacetum coccineum]
MEVMVSRPTPSSAALLMYIRGRKNTATWDKAEGGVPVPHRAGRRDKLRQGSGVGALGCGAPNLELNFVARVVLLRLRVDIKTVIKRGETQYYGAGNSELRGGTFSDLVDTP